MARLPITGLDNCKFFIQPKNLLLYLKVLQIVEELSSSDGINEYENMEISQNLYSVPPFFIKRRGRYLSP